MLTRPKILILDDARARSTWRPRRRIQDALDADGHAWAGATTFVVAQRISTVLKADKIVVLDQGQIVAEGTHRELIAVEPDLPGDLRLAARQRVRDGEVS